MLFDSGAGGLSIAKTLLHKSPIALRMSYFADHSAFPYGNKDEVFLVSHVSKLIEEFSHQHKPDLIVIACNTASTIVLPELRSRLRTPFVGVVPAIKPAAKLSRSKRIGVLATPATVNREYTSQLINEFAPDCRVFLHGSDALVQCAENVIHGQPPERELIEQELERLLTQDRNIDTIVLACTHFPLIAKSLKSIATNVDFWVDSSDAIARRAFDLLDLVAAASPDVISIGDHKIDIFISTQSLEDVVLESLKENYEGFLIN